MIDDKQRRPSGAPSGQFCLGGREYRLGPAAERGAVTAWPAAEAGGGVWDDVLIRRLRPGAGERQVRTRFWPEDFSTSAVSSALS